MFGFSRENRRCPLYNVRIFLCIYCEKARFFGLFSMNKVCLAIAILLGVFYAKSLVQPIQRLNIFVINSSILKPKKALFPGLIYRASKNEHKQKEDIYSALKRP